jgi:glycerol-3-phosphate dehydrogenase (NAD(P)+)
VIGAGAWGTTVSNLIADKGNNVTLWVHSEKTFDAIQNKRENTYYLPGIKLNNRIQLTTSIKEALDNKNTIFIAVPSKYLIELIPEICENISENSFVISLIKGMMLTQPQELILDYLYRSFAKIPKENYFVLSGPNFAYEIARKLPAATVIGGSNLEYLSILQSFLSTEYFRVYTNTDIIGIQLGGVLKNIIAISAGLCDGLKLGSNTKSSLIVRGINEMKKIFVSYGGNIDTLYGLSGLGDLIGTCTSDLSRNRWAGMQIAMGASIEEIVEIRKITVEGISSLPAVMKMANKLNVELPICNEVYEIVHNKKDVKKSIKDLMLRTLKKEF